LTRLEIISIKLSIIFWLISITKECGYYFS